MSAKDDYPDIAICAVETGYPIEAEEAACALAEINQLRRWKAEAIIVDDRWEKVFEVLGKPGPLGGFKSDNVLAEVIRLKSHIEKLRKELAKWGWGDMHYGNQEQDSEVVHVLKETE